jgi:hypothetical protein
MTTRKLTAGRLIGAALLAVASADRSAAQAAADYARAAALQERYEAAAIDVAGPPAAIPGTHRFWYRKSVRGGHQFVAVDADTLQKAPAFDHEKVAASLSAATGRALTGLKLPFATIVFADEGGSFTVSVDGTPYRCSLADAACRKTDAGPRVGAGLTVGRRTREDGPRLSPDGRWEAVVNNFNVAIRPANGRALTYLSTDGSEGNYYEQSSIVWSPDSHRIAAYR